MKFRTQKITALMVAAIVGLSTLGSVSVMAAESTEAMAVPADQAGMVVDGDAAAADGDAISSDFIQGTFKPSETTVQAQDSYEYPFLGLKLSLSEELLKQIKDLSRRIQKTKNYCWRIRHIEQRILSDNTTSEPLMHGVLELEYEITGGTRNA